MRGAEEQPVSDGRTTDANAQTKKLLDRGLEAVVDMVQGPSQGTMLVPAPLLARDTFVMMHVAMR